MAEPVPDGMKRSALSMLFAGLLALVFVGVGVVLQQDLRFPPNSLPWRPLELDAPPHWLAHWQMHRLKSDGALCHAALRRSRLQFTPQADRRVDGDCSFINAVRSDVSPIAWNIRPNATCVLTAALYWYQGRLQEIARREMKSPLIRIDHVGIFACRNVNNEAGGSRSQHASANAIDITAFHFADGRTVTVTRDYGKPNEAGRFLAAAHDAACGIFNGVLGPDYNRLHATHFHFDMGPYWICR
jgi:hypothetical protein